MTFPRYIKNEKGYGGMAVVIVMAVFMFAFMFSKPIVTGLVTGNESINISENIDLDNISVEGSITEEFDGYVEDNISLNTTEVKDIIEENASMAVILKNISIEWNITEENISLNVDVENASVNVSKVNVSVDNITVKNEGINISEENITEMVSEVSNISEKIIGRVIINKPVKFVKKIKLTGIKKNLVVELPNNANKIVVKKIMDGVEKDISDKIIIKDKERVKELDEHNLVTGGVVTEVKERLFEKVVDWLKNLVRITGYFVAEEGDTEIIIEEEVEEVEVEYEIPGPSAVEEELSEWKKRIVISSEVHYEDILSYMFISDSPAKAVRLYWIIDGTRQEIGFDGYDTNEDYLVDYIEWIIPNLSNQTYEVEISIINVQSYPSVGGNWTVMFNTTGTADLRISTINGTIWSNVNKDNDLKFLELICGGDIINYNWVNNSVFVGDYSCDQDSKEVSKVLTYGKHNLEFDYGGQKAYAYNDASYTSCSNVTSNGNYNLTSDISYYNSSEFCFNINASNVVFDCLGNSIMGDYSSIHNIIGVYVHNATNVTIKNCVILDFSYNIYFENNSNDGYIINNTIYDVDLNVTYGGIGLDTSHGILIENNTIANFSGDGSNEDRGFLTPTISTTDSHNTTINNNLIYNVEGRGISIYALHSTCKNNLISNNKINDTSSASIDVSECDDSKISSNTVIDSSEEGIKLYLSSNLTITGNTVFNSSTYSISSDTITESLIEHNVFNLTQTLSTFYITNSDNNTLNNNTIEGSAYEGLEMIEGSNNNVIKLSTIKNSSFDAIIIIDSYNNSLYNLTLINSQSSGIYLINSSGNVFVDSNLTNNDLDNSSSFWPFGDIAMGGANSLNATLINVNFNQSDVNFSDSGSGLFNIQWYLDIYVNDSGGDVEDANVSLWDITGASIFSLNTSSNGGLDQKNITEYFQNSSGKTYKTNYTINTTKDNYGKDSRQLNLTDNSQLRITLNTLPNLTSINLTPINPTTFDELICNFTIVDNDVGDNLHASVGWYKNGAEIIGITINVNNGSANWTTLGKENTKDGENWTCQVKPTDEKNNGTTQNSNSVIIDSCGMSLKGTNVLYGDMNCSGEAITIGASDTSLNCNGTEINYTSTAQNQQGIDIGNKDNVTIKNCNLNALGGQAKSWPIRTSAGASEITIHNNNITTDTNDAIYLVATSSNVSHNIIKGEGGGIHLSGTSSSVSDNNVIHNNNINSSGSSSNAIKVRGNADGNHFFDNNIIEAGENGIFFDQFLSNYLNNNNLTNNVFSNIEDYDLYIEVGSDGTYLIDQPISSYILTGAGSIVYIKDSTYGEIKYLEAISGSGSNFSSDIRISNNSIEVNSSNSGLNKSANLTLYDPNITIGDDGKNPRAYKDNSVCSSGICGTITKTGTNYSYNVTGFTKYGVELNNKPQAQNVTLTSTDLLNRTNGTLTGSFDHYDVDGDSQSGNRTKWYLNGSEKSYGEDDTEDKCSRVCGLSTGNCLSSNNLFDENWGTSITIAGCAGHSPESFSINYTVPIEIKKGNWTIKYTGSGIEGYCYNGSWQDLNFPSNPFLPLSRTKVILDSCISYGSTLQLKINATVPSEIIYEEKVSWQLENSTKIDKRFTTKGQNWSFNISVSDGFSWGNWNNSNQLTIANDVPDKVTLISPTNENDTLLNRTPLFNWNSVSADLDGDTLTYDINITRIGSSGEPDCSTNSKYVTGISATNYVIDEELCVDDWYNWTVRANDGEDYGEWSDVWNFSVMSTSIILVNGSIHFGSLAINIEVNTTGSGEPEPLTVENNGNVNVNISIYAKDTLWERSYAGFNSSYFQFKAGNSSENNSFDWLNSIFDWRYMQNESNKITTFAVLNYSNSNDLAELEIKVKVPPDEPPGNKSSIIVFEAIS